MKFTNKFNLPEPVVRAMTFDDYSRGASNRSITQLIDSPRIRILRAEHDDTITEDVSDRAWSVLGRAVHKIFEDNTDPDTEQAEERMFLEVDGWVISGAIDLQVQHDQFAIENMTMVDYKCTSVWSVIYGKQEWVNQLNAYAWLARHANGTKVDRLQIVTVLRDWNRNEAARRDDYPQCPITIVPIDCWSDEDQDAYMAERIRIHSEAEFARLTGDPIPLCTDHERWMKPTKYAVKKDGRKTAVRVLNSMEEAEDYIKQKNLDSKHSVELRPGEPTRCVGDYCNVAHICDQFQSEVWGAAE